MVQCGEDRSDAIGVLVTQVVCSEAAEDPRPFARVLRERGRGGASHWHTRHVRTVRTVIMPSLRDMRLRRPSPKSSG